MMRTVFLSIALSAALPVAATAQPAPPAPGSPPARQWGTPVPPAVVQGLRQRIAARAAEGPHSQIDPATSALVLVEFQRDWLDPRGTLRQVVTEPQVMDEAARRSEAALAAARAAGIRVIHVGIRFAPGHAELGTAYYGVRATQSILRPFQEGTPGPEWMPPFEPRAGELVVSGRTGMSGFAGSNLDSILRNNGIRTLFLAGFATEVCFESTIREGHDRGYNMIALTDATASFNTAARDASLRVGISHFAYMTDSAAFIAAADRVRAARP